MYQPKGSFVLMIHSSICTSTEYFLIFVHVDNFLFTFQADIASVFIKFSLIIYGYTYKFDYFSIIYYYLF